MSPKQKAGRQGGNATFRKHGSDHMREIGKRGAAVTWSRYRLQPVGISGWALINKQTGKVKSIWS